MVLESLGEWVAGWEAESPVGRLIATAPGRDEGPSNAKAEERERRSSIQRYLGDKVRATWCLIESTG